MNNMINKLKEKFNCKLNKVLGEIFNRLDDYINKQLIYNKEQKINIQNIDEKITQLINKESERKFVSRLNQLENEILRIKQSINDSSGEIINIKEKLYRSDWEPKQNIKQYLQQVAGLETAKYIIKNMPNVPAYNVTLDILTNALSKVTIDGMYLEFGVFSGRTINHIADKTLDKIIYGFDSFEGLPEDWRTGFEEGTFKRINLPKVNSNVKLVKGWFNDTLPKFVEEHNEKCAFIHIDCDLYSSTKCVFDLLEDKIVSGTIIVFDEYFNYPDWQNGEYKALQEFIIQNNLLYEYIGYVEIMEQVAIRII